MTGEIDRPQDALDEKPWGALPLATWIDLRKLLFDLDAVDAQGIVETLKSSGVPENILSRMRGDDPLIDLGKVLLGEESASKLIRQCEHLIDLTDIRQIGELEISGLPGDESDAEILTSMVEVLSCARRSKDIPILKPFPFVLKSP